MLELQIIGNLGADAEVKESNGSKFVAMRVAHSERYKDQNGNETERTQWVDVTLNGENEKLLPYLKQGTRIYAVGRVTLRVYSSPKLRQMVAGISCAARHLELIGGVRDDVPRQLINPQGGAILNVAKYYQCEELAKSIKGDDYVTLVDKQGKSYQVVKGGWVAPIQEVATQSEDTTI